MFHTRRQLCEINLLRLQAHKPSRQIRLPPTRNENDSRAGRDQLSSNYSRFTLSSRKDFLDKRPYFEGN